ncbi:MAG: DoxX family protein [Actinomycetota bacterium]|nr:DoxX family protein [Actinomycetota bacterium]
MQQLDLGLLLLRLVFGVFLAYHGYNKVFGGGGLAGTARWFGSIGMKWPLWQARLAAATEIGAGLMFAAGLLTPLAAAGIVGVMVVAIVVEHWKVGFFIFKPNQGWEYCASIAVVAVAVGTMGAGRWSLDRAFDLELTGWTGAVVVLVAGIGGALAQLAVSYRPKETS